MDKNSIEYNDKIKSKELKIIDEEGNFLGILSKADGLKLAEEKGLDLVICAAKSNPPVAKLCLLDKYLFNLKKKEKQIKKNTKNMELKKIKMGVNIDVHDYNTKVSQAEKFLKQGNMVSFFMKLRRKEMPQAPKGIELLKKIASQLENIQVSNEPSMEKNTISMTVKPFKLKS